MHQTTVRFGPDLWGDIEVEAERAGVSVAQYVRDSALMRVAYTRGRDGDPHYEAAMGLAAAAPVSPPRDRTADTREHAMALRAETQQARRHARALREETKRRRAAGAEDPSAPADAPAVDQPS